MKVMFVVPCLSGGGAERVVSVLANNLSKNYDITIVCLLKEDKTYYTNENVTIKFISSKVKSRIKRNFSKFESYVRLLKTSKPDVVIAFTYDCSMITAIATRFIKTKLIISERNDPNHDPESSLLRELRNILYLLADGYVFQTNDARIYYNKKIQLNSVIIGNPLNDNLPEPYGGEREKRIVCVSRLAPQKNIRLLIDAFKECSVSLNDYTLDIYGDGPLKNELGKYISEKHMENRIFLKGYVTNIYEEIYKASLFVIPSNYEGISNSMLEALALGIPVIATDCPAGGAHTYISNGVNGFLVEVNNKSQLSKTMLMVLGDHALRKNISDESIKIRSLLNVDQITSEWKRYIDLVRSKNV